MTPTAVVARLAVRELWMSFRLLVLLAAYLGAVALVTAVPAPSSTVLLRLALALALAAVAGSSIAAWSLSHERSLGRLGWLAARSVQRRTILMGWFASLALVTVAGVLGAGLLGWAALGGSAGRIGPTVFALAMIASIGGAVALQALGLAVGSVLRPRLASVVAGALSAIVITGGWVVLPGLELPVEAIAHLQQLDRPISVALQGTGGSLSLAVILLLAAAWALGRVDL
ncbi:MAG: hypothetical protein ABIW50_02930 [Candidatus Limnocylindria bacterium]